MVRERFGKETREKAYVLSEVLYRTTGELEYFDHTRTLRQLVRLAREHCKIMEADCNGTKSIAMGARLPVLEDEIKTLAKSLNLRISFSGDPRGHTVRLHNSIDTLFNSIGGPSGGYGIG